jgi:hypothetical protein
MHLITQPVHVLPCSNSAMKGNNGTKRIPYHDIAGQTTAEPPYISLLKLGIRDCRLPWVSPNVNSSSCREQRKGQVI